VVGVDDDRRGGARTSRRVEVDALALEGELDPRQRPQRRPGRHQLVRELLALRREAVEQLVGLGLEQLLGDDRVLLGVLAAQQGEPVRPGQRQPVAQQVTRRVVRAVGIHRVGEGPDVPAPPVEGGVVRRGDEPGGGGVERVGVALVDGVGEHPGVVEADASLCLRLGDVREELVDPDRGRDPLPGDAGRQLAVPREPP